MGNHKSQNSEPATTTPLATTQGGPTSDGDNKSPRRENIPIEEASLTDLYPELDATSKIPLDRIDCKHEHSHLHQEFIKNPLPAISVPLLKPVPVPSYSVHKSHHSKSASSFKKAKFVLPEFSRFVEATEDELAERVEYDMDEQDRAWLILFNTKRKKLGEKEISYDVFEFVMDQMEKCWFDLILDIPKSSTQDSTLLSEDITCAVCDDGEAENSNAIVFCDGCNLAVHQDCYGVPFIPEGQWLCRKCMLSPETPVSCLLCPNDGGAYKQTNTNKWAHLICAMWIPECHISNTVFMEPIEGIEAIQKSRWKLLCYICQKRNGAPIQCANRQCFAAFHVTCARKAKLYMRMRGQEDSSQFKAYCDRHCPKEYLEKVDVNLSVQIASETLSRSAPVSESKTNPITVENNQESKNRRILHNDFSKSTKRLSVFSPVLPNYILRQLMAHPSGLLPKKRSDLLLSIAKYWSLKKESRRGAMLLKRLHLEPWTANASASKEDDDIKAQKYQILSMIRKDLEKARILLDVVRKRERQKLKYYKLLNSYYEYAASPLTPILKPILDKCKSLDRHGFFADAVDETLVPDYYTHIKNPMDFSTMTRLLNNHEYHTLEKFEEHINLICDNCTFYNKPDTLYSKSARKLKAYFASISPSIHEQLQKVQVNINGLWDKKSENFKELLDLFDD